MPPDLPRTPQPWFESWPSHLECVFSANQAASNAEYLLQKIPWLRGALHRRPAHPLASAWWFNGPPVFIELNTLAEDIKAVEGSPHLARLLKDMGVPKEYAPAKHTLHIAALFQRGGNEVLEFFNAKNDRVPDFLVSISGSEVAVEAKMLTASDVSRRFSALGFSTLDRLKR